MTYGSTLTYGNFTESDIALRDHMYGRGYPFVHRGDQAYRITELVGPTHAKRWNYQAVECDPAEAEAWRRDRAEFERSKEDAPARAREASVPFNPPEGIAAFLAREAEEAEEREDARAREGQWQPPPPEQDMVSRTVDLGEAVHALVNQDPALEGAVAFAESLPFEAQEGWKPSYATFARANGWAGKGRIPNAIRAKYEAQHGKIETWQDRELQRRERAAQGVRNSGIRKSGQAHGAADGPR